jgi:hypothetical protein
MQSVDSLGAFPSLFSGALVSAPPTLSISNAPPCIPRWNRGEGTPPRTAHHSQRGAHPPVHPLARAENLLDHTSCRGSVGATHVVAKLALRGLAEDTGSLLTATRNSAHLLNNLRRRTAAEEALRRHDEEQAEWEKRFWLQQLLTEREAAAARARGVSLAAHARARAGATPRGSLVAAGASLGDSLAVRLAAATPPSPDAPLPVPGLANNLLNVAGGELVSRRLSLLTELSPREKGLSPSQQAARRYAPPCWKRVEPSGALGWPSSTVGRAPAEPRVSAALAPRDEGCAPGAVSIARPDLAQQLLGGGGGGGGGA